MSSSQYVLAEKTTTFSKDVLRFCNNIKLSVVTRPLVDQLVRSATSIGANYSEANNAASRSDFRNKIFIAKKEAAETKYWLMLIDDYCDEKDQLLYLQAECQHLLMTFQKIISTLKALKQ